MSEGASTADLFAIYRYPVKGLSAEALPRTRLAPGQTIPADRRYAIENGPSGFDPAARPLLAVRAAPAGGRTRIRAVVTDRPTQGCWRERKRGPGVAVCKLS